jgi:hypothetical protein
MAVADGTGQPTGIYVASASPHEVTLVEETLHARFVDPAPARLIGDRAYDSDGLDARLAAQGITMIAPNRPASSLASRTARCCLTTTARS